MMNQKIDLVNENNILNKTDEKKILNEISKAEFFREMEKEGFDIETLRDFFDSKKISGLEQQKFNNALQNIKERSRIKISDTILYMEEHFIKIKKILSLLDSNTKFIVKKELSEKWKIDIDCNNLFEIMR